MNKLIGYGTQAIAYFSLYMTTGNPYIPVLIFMIAWGRGMVKFGKLNDS